MSSLPVVKRSEEVESLISKIRERIADPLRAVDSAAWVEPMPTVAAPATVAEIESAEAALGFAIPQLLRRLYIEVANGGFGPAYGLEGVPRIPRLEGSADIVALYQQFLTPDPDNPAWLWPHGLVPLIGGGCLYLECVYFTEPPHAVVLFDGGKVDLSKSVNDVLTPVSPSLEHRLIAWLDGVDLTTTLPD